jgi:hypothetical protein
LIDHAHSGVASKLDNFALRVSKNGSFQRCDPTEQPGKKKPASELAGQVA